MKKKESTSLPHYQLATIATILPSFCRQIATILLPVSYQIARRLLPVESATIPLVSRDSRDRMKFFENRFRQMCNDLKGIQSNDVLTKKACNEISK